MMGPWFGWGFGGNGQWFMLAIMIVFLGLVIWGIAVLVRRSGGHGCCGSDHQPSESVLEILKRRYAQGEINKEEYEDKKKALL